MRRGRRSTQRRLRAAAGSLLLSLVWSLVWAGGAGADTIPLEVVGVQPLVPGKTQGVPREEAIQEALWEGVQRVARDLLMEDQYVEPGDAAGAGDGSRTGASTPPTDGGTDAASTESLRKALGRDVVPYTRGFKIVEDRGEQPALFSEDPQAESEYVVVVKVQVDQDNVREALESAGLLHATQAAASVQAVPLEIVGLTAYPGLEALEALLLGPVGAETVAPVRFERGRARLRVEGDFDGAELLDRLLAESTPGLSLEPLSTEAGVVLVRATWVPPPAPAAEGEGTELGAAGERR